eukprot:gene9536-1741_t
MEENKETKEMLKEENLYKKVLLYQEDMECEGLLAVYLSCERKALVQDENVCLEEKEKYLECRKKWKSYDQKKALEVMQYTKGLFFSNTSAPVIVSGKLPKE